MAGVEARGLADEEERSLPSAWMYLIAHSAVAAR